MGVYLSTPIDPQVRDDIRIDPRIKPILSLLKPKPSINYYNREQLLASTLTPDYLSELQGLNDLLDMCDDKIIANPSTVITNTEKITSLPDGNTILMTVTRPITQLTDSNPAIYFIHGGGMAGSSCFAGPYRFWTRLLATKGLIVASVEFRNSLIPSACADIAPFPGGLNDCVSGFHWMIDNAASLKIDLSKIVISGDSGGANLALATALRLRQEANGRPDSSINGFGAIKGLYLMCPFISYHHSDFPSAKLNDRLLFDISSTLFQIAYGPAANPSDPLAWPINATPADFQNFPPVVVSLNECDPFLDQGLQLFRTLLAAGVRTRCQQIMGTVHANEILFGPLMPEVSHSTARDIAAFVTEVF